MPHPHIQLMPLTTFALATALPLHQRPAASIVVVQSPSQREWVKIAGQISRGARPKDRPFVLDCFFAGLPVDRSQVGGSSYNWQESSWTSPNSGFAPN